MKTLFTIITLGLGLNIIHAQEIRTAKVPGPVKETFNKQYPGAIVEKWEKDESRYEAEFLMNQVETRATYDIEGNFIESEIEIKTSELPKGVTDYIATNLHGKRVREAAKITDASGRISYKAEVDREDYIFDFDCSFVRKDSEKEKDDDY